MRAKRSPKDMCQIFCFNEAVVNRLRANLPAEEDLNRAAERFSTMGSRTRLLMLYCLSQADELCVCDIATSLRMNLSTVSHQLRVLRSAGLVRFRNEGKITFYRLADSETGDLLRSELERAVATVS